MIDLFGMGHKEPQENKEPSAPAADEAPKAPRGSHRLWAFLLVLDSIFVIVFGGALAANIFHYWKSPAVPATPVQRRRPAPKAADPAPAASTATAAVPAAPAKPSEPVKPVEPPKPAHHAEAPRPPKPSLLNDAPKPRSTPALAAGAAAASAPAAAPAAPAGEKKAQPVVFKLRAPNAGAVQLVGAFIVHGGRKDMTKDSDGQWSVKLYLNPGQYRYFFAVDKKKTLDPENPQSDRGASLLNVP